MALAASAVLVVGYQPQQATAETFDLARDFSLTANPNGAWSYGWAPSIGGPFTPITVSGTVSVAGGIPIQYWQLAAGRYPAVYHNGGTNTWSPTEGTFPPSATWFHPGENGQPENFGVIRFSVPAGQGGTYDLWTSVEPHFLPAYAGDSDFHIVKNGTELYGQFLAKDQSTTYTNRLALVAGDTIDFLIGRGVDSNLFGSGLKIQATLSPTTNPVPPEIAFDLSNEFSITSNPSGVWTYGYLTTLNGSFAPLTAARTFSSDNGVPIAAWELNTFQIPVVAKVLGESIAISDGGRFTAPPGTVFFAPGSDNTPQSFGAIRFTVPADGAGDYVVETSVRSLFDGTRSRDADFHVVKNGEELFGNFLPPNSSTGYTNLVSLNVGDTIDFAVGKGADGTTIDTGLKIQAVFRRRTVRPTVPTVINGSFEIGIPTVTSVQLDAPDASSISGWKVSDGSIDYIGASGWKAGDGNRSLDLSGASAGKVQQTVSGFIPGQRYRLSFLMAGNPLLIPSLPAVKELRASVGDVTQDYSFNASGLTTVNMGWTEKTLDFVSATNSVTITFASLTPGIGGPALDRVAIAALTTNAPPLPTINFDLERDFSLASNPNGAWSYGWSPVIGGGFTPLAFKQTVTVAGGIPIQSWQLAASRYPAVYHNGGTNTWSPAEGTFPPDATWFHPGDTGQPENFGVIRFTVPAGRAGVYALRTAVEPHFKPAFSGDCDFHVIKNSTELFGRYLAHDEGASYSNVLFLAGGDTIDFVIGRGADSNLFGSGLKISATLTPTITNPPPVGLVVNGSFELGSNPGISIDVPGPDSTTITGWTVESASVDYIGSRWVAGDGVRCLDLSGTDAATLSQTIGGLTPGQHYRLSFLMAANPEVGAITARLRANIGGASQEFSFVQSGFTTSNLGWANKTMVFTATSSSHKLSFVSLNPGWAGAALDKVAIVPTTNAPPVPPTSFDLARDFSMTANPNGAWSYGWAPTVGGNFTALAATKVTAAAPGVSVESWQLTPSLSPSVFQNRGTSTWNIGATVVPPGTVWVNPGENGRPENYAVIRFKVPAGGAGDYLLRTSVRPFYAGSPQGDTDFHVLKDGSEIFGQFLSPTEGTGYTNVMALAEGDAVDLVFGRGHDGNAFGSSLRIEALIVPTRITPPPTNAVRPAILSIAPLVQTVAPGAPASITVTATGTAPLSYLWQRNGINLVGRTNATLAFEAVMTNNAGTYRCIVSNPFGSVSSSNAVINVIGGGTTNFAPVITRQPTNLTVNAGTLALLRVTASGALPLAYTWTHNGNIVGSSTPFLALSNVSLSMAGHYQVRVSNPYGVVTSQVATLTVVIPSNRPPVAHIVAEPLLSLFPGTTNPVVISADGSTARVIFDGSASSDGDNDALDYFWFADGASVPFADGVRTTNSFDLGSHAVTLLVDDGNSTGTDTVDFTVVTAAEVVSDLADLVWESNLPRKNKRPLIATLWASAWAFENGNTTSGIQRLEAFCNKVQAQVAPLDPALAERLEHICHAILRAVKE